MQLLSALLSATKSLLPLQMITNRGVKVWPKGNPNTSTSDHWRCRFHLNDSQKITARDIVTLMGHIVDAGLDVIKTENLYQFDGKAGYSLAKANNCAA